MNSNPDITKICPPLVWWLYDRVIARRVEGLNAGVIDELGQLMADGARILDVGCGGGQLAIELSRRHPGLEIVGVDADAGQIRRANRRIDGTLTGVRFQQASAEHLPFADGSFDAVVSVGSLKHWPDASAGMSEMVRVLQPGGELRVLEAARGSSLSDARTTVECLRYPRLARGVGARFFRTCVAGPAIDVGEACALAQSRYLDLVTVELVPHAPAFWQIAARKRHIKSRNLA